MASPGDEDVEEGNVEAAQQGQEEEAKPLSTEDELKEILRIDRETEWASIEARLVMTRRAAEAADVTAITAMVAYEKACDMIETQGNLGNLLAKAMATEDDAIDAWDDYRAECDQEDWAEMYEAPEGCWPSPARSPKEEEEEETEEEEDARRSVRAPWMYARSPEQEEEGAERNAYAAREEGEEEEKSLSTSEGDEKAVAMQQGEEEASSTSMTRDVNEKACDMMEAQDHVGDLLAIAIGKEDSAKEWEEYDDERRRNRNRRQQGRCDAADALAHLASCCPPSEGMPGGFRTSKCLALSLPWTDHWWVRPMEVAALRVLAKPRGRGNDGTWHDLLVLEAVSFPLFDGRALVWVQASDL